ncbi:hypothetical protein LTR53_002203 [Teratosphaeriaceae sp. CCFEE 6253]|nr:hypothetical protein LTR53_002203 [Teratosphaeriaceae sp. CCFEE 6253]
MRVARSGAASHAIARLPRHRKRASASGRDFRWSDLTARVSTVMPLLRRQTAKLLRTVEGKPHASSEDHEDGSLPDGAAPRFQLPTPASSTNSLHGAEHVFRKPSRDVATDDDPQSSSADEKDSDRTFKYPNGRPSPVRKHDATPQFQTKHVPQFDGPKSQDPAPVANFKQVDTRRPQTRGAQPTHAFRQAGVASPPPSSGGKRSQAEMDEEDSSDDAVFGSSQASRYRKPRTAVNIHAPKGGFGKEAERRRLRGEREKKAAEVKAVQAAEAEKAHPTFKRPDIVPTTYSAAAFKEPGTITANSRLGGDADGDNRDDDPSSGLSSPPLSPLSNTDPTDDLILIEPQHHHPPACAICSSPVPVAWREDFEDRHPAAKHWSYKWQQRFCRAHRQREAALLWRERGYPEIDWGALPTRLRQRRHAQHIQRIISGEIESVFRTHFEAKVKSRAKTLLQVAGTGADDDDGTAGRAPGGSAGYYGPRGEKLLSDHIVSTFAAALREHAAQDVLIAASGVAGGVAGFVQSVLVPELACSLIREDLGLELGGQGEGEAVAVLAESAALGELLHPELDEEGLLHGGIR